MKLWMGPVLIVAILAWGYSFDVRHWLRDRRERKQRAAMRLGPAQRRAAAGFSFGEPECADLDELPEIEHPGLRQIKGDWYRGRPR